MGVTKAVQAAGGVVWRSNGTVLEVALVHRPRYGDWTLPKGKVRPGEHLLGAAVREVHEEIGSNVVVTSRIGTVRYTVEESLKRVTYWSMRHHHGQFEPNGEVSDIEWLTVGDAVRRLTYDLDRVVLTDFATTPEPDAVIVLVRHAKAGKRSEWAGDDDLRPLDPNGIRQADELAWLLAQFGPDSVLSAEPVRCQQTVEPLAAKLGLTVEVDAAFSDDTFIRTPADTQTALLALAKPGSVSVVCSQGVTIPSIVDRLGPGIRLSDTRKGAWWVLSLLDGEVIAADHYDAP
jgi:8-oxo-dGTP diphosphatase